MHQLYGRGGGTDEQPIVLTAQESAELMAFLEALSSPEAADAAQQFQFSISARRALLSPQIAR